MAKNSKKTSWGDSWGVSWGVKTCKILSDCEGDNTNNEALNC